MTNEFKRGKLEGLREAALICDMHATALDTAGQPYVHYVEVQQCARKITKRCAEVRAVKVEPL